MRGTTTRSRPSSSATSTASLRSSAISWATATTPRTPSRRPSSALGAGFAAVPWRRRLPHLDVPHRHQPLLQCPAQPPATGSPLDAGPEPAQTAGSAQPERAAEAHAATDALARALARLDEGQRACWVLRELHGLHYDEIAQITGISEPSVRGRLYRARRTLAQEMFPWR